jgi:hypothetical protein
MDWFFALEAATQVAIIGVLTGVVTAIGAVSVAAVKNAGKIGSGQAEIAAVTLDSSAVKQVAAALEALNVTILEQNKTGHEGSRDVMAAVERATRELEQLHREIRALSDKLRSAK